MRVEVELQMPKMPNFLRVNQGVWQHIKAEEEPCIDVGELAPEQVEAFVNEWAAAFYAHAEARRAALSTKDEAE